MGNLTIENMATDRAHIDLMPVVILLEFALAITHVEISRRLANEDIPAAPELVKDALGAGAFVTRVSLRTHLMLAPVLINQLMNGANRRTERRRRRRRRRRNHPLAICLSLSLSVYPRCFCCFTLKTPSSTSSSSPSTTA